LAEVEEIQMRVGDMVTINQSYYGHPTWEEAEGQVGVIIALAKRLHIPAAKVMVMGEIAEFDLNELAVVSCKH
tara:strand:- start:451 stop:669 length:219 start_codon:yes stop_codon:yes gene_type:complete